jgi:SWI/SNF-related matrix-associated actin-dependent regulator of chromatin subfamily A protein 2/4
MSTTEKRISVVDRGTGKVLSGEDAPTSTDLQNWLQSHPGWEVHEDSGDESGEEGSDDEDKPVPILPGMNVKPPVVELAEKDPEAIGEEVAKEVIQQAKAKVEDDEYKHQGEQNYYTIAHTIHEPVTDQANMLVNGRLKEYQIKVTKNLLIILYLYYYKCFLFSLFIGIRMACIFIQQQS